MYICLCKGITDHQIRETVNSGAMSMREVRDRLGVMTQCGKCAGATREIVQDQLDNLSADKALFYAVA